MNGDQPLVKPVYRRLFLFLLTIALLIFLVKIYPLISDLVVVLIISVVLAYVFRPGMVALEVRGIPRIYSILGFFVLGSGLIIIALRFLIPVLIDEIGSLLNNIEALDLDQVTGKVSQWVDDKVPGFRALMGLDADSLENLIASFRSSTSSYLSKSIGLLAGAVNAMALSIVIPFITFFLLRDGDRWMKNWMEAVPNRYFEMAMSLSYEVNQRLGNYIRSILLESLIIGLVSWVAFQVMGLKFALVLGIINGLLNMIPFFGPLIAYIPVLLIVLLTYTPLFSGVLYAVVILVAVQMLDNVALKPMIISRSVNVHPAAVLLAVLIGGRLAGALGMFIAVPVFAVVRILVVDFYTHLKDYRII